MITKDCQCTKGEVFPMCEDYSWGKCLLCGREYIMERTFFTWYKKEEES